MYWSDHMCSSDSEYISPVLLPEMHICLCANEVKLCENGSMSHDFLMIVTICFAGEIHGYLFELLRKHG